MIYDNEKLDKTPEITIDYISESECCYDFNCKKCCNLEDCLINAHTRCNSEFAESIDFGCCDSEDESWEQLMD